MVSQIVRQGTNAPIAIMLQGVGDGRSACIGNRNQREPGLDSSLQAVREDWTGEATSKSPDAGRDMGSLDGVAALRLKKFEKSVASWPAIHNLCAPVSP